MCAGIESVAVIDEGTAFDKSGETMMNRRAMLGKMMRVGGAAIAGAALVGTGALGGVPGAAADETGFWRATANVNLRSGPRADQRVRLVIPAGAGVTGLGGRRNGYLKVSYQGTPGWAHADYLEVTNGGSTDQPVPVGTALTTDRVNMRTGSSTSAPVLFVLEKGRRVEVTNRYENGFRYVLLGGAGGWIYATYLGADSQPSWYLKTTSAVNLRKEPSTSAAVMVVIPKGSSVRATDQLANGFRQVVFDNKTGWVYEAYLA